MLNMDVTVLRDMLLYIAYTLGSALLLGLAPACMRTGVRRSDPSLGATLFGVIVALGAWAIVLAGGAPALPAGKTLALLVVAGVLTALLWLCLFTALTGGLSSKVMPVVNLAILPAMIVARFSAGQELSLWRLCAVVIVLLGTVMIESRTKSLRGQLWLLYAVAAMLFSTGLQIFRASALDMVETPLYNAFRCGVAAVLVCIFAICRGKFRLLGAMPSRFWVALPIAALAVGVSWFLSGRAAGLGDWSTLRPLSIFSFFAMMLFSRIIQRERQPGSAIFGTILVLFGMFVMESGW